MNKGNIAIGVLAGVAIGAALGLLFSPHTGAVNRRIVRKKGEDIADDVTETIKDSIEVLGDSITEKFDMLKHDILAKFRS